VDKGVDITRKHVEIKTDWANAEAGDDIDSEFYVLHGRYCDITK